MVALMASAPLALTGSYAAAHGTQNETTSHATTEVAAPPQADIKPFEDAKLSLTQAISDAQREMRGNTLEARFEVWHGEPSYLIRTWSTNQVWQGRIDANNGRFIDQPMAIPEDQLSPRLKKDIAGLQNVQTNLMQAVQSAEQKEGGKAMLASVQSRSPGSASYRLDLVKNNRLHVAMVDAQTGQLR
jgi:uncharacterized membrane protein YkoI